MNPLNPTQQAAVTLEASPIYVIAGPGSGKTTTMVERIRARVALGTEPARMIVLTFTNAGAQEFIKRLAPIKPGYAGTLHGYCLRLLQKWGHLIGYRRGGVTISILPEADRLEMIEAARDALGLKKKVTMKAVMELADNPHVRLVWQAYRDTLKRQNMVDYDQILTEGRRLLMLDAVRSSLQVDELFGDEMQDSGETDWDIVELIPAKAKFFIGDPDQSIYAFRGGRPELLTRRADQSDNTLLLELNYRSDHAICEAATALIRRNLLRLPKAVLPATNDLGAIDVFEAPDDAEEAGWIASRLSFLHSKGLPFSEMAVIARTNAIAKKARALLAGYGITVSRPPAIDPPPGWDLAKLLVGIAMDPTNDAYVAKLLTNPERAAGPSTKKVEEMRRDAVIAKQTLAGFVGLKAPAGMTDLPRWLVENGVKEEAMASLADMVTGCATFADLLSAMCDPEAFQVDPGTRYGVTVSTIHAVKGREFDVVVMAGMEEGTLPALKDDPEEARRLAFVGMTRARHVLLLTWARKRSGEQPWQTRENLLPSRFIKEALNP